MRIKSLMATLLTAALVACSESFLASTDDPAPPAEPIGDGVIVRYGPVIRVDSLYPVAVAPPGQTGMPHRMRAFKGYFLCSTPTGFVRREVETFTHNGAKYLRVYPIGCIAVRRDSTRN
jgi:hypothetical protein